jgi:hypothetical protein
MALFLTLLDRFKNHIFYERKRMKKLALILTEVKNSGLFDEFVCKLGHFKTGVKRHERVEFNVFLFDEILKGSKLLKIFKISLTFHFDKL